jgi:GT2 family glycosyltransferase
MRVDVIVSTYNRAALLRDALVSLVRQEVSADCSLGIIVVDNASTDGTKAVFEGVLAPPRVRVTYRFEPAPGVCHARNRGVREATADWLAFFDDDQLADPHWLGELLSAARASGALCVGGRVTPRMEGGGSVPLPAFCRGLLGETPPGETEGPLVGKSLPTTGNSIVHRSVFEAIGLFDPQLVHGAEDADLFRRVRGAGYAIWYAPGARAIHRIPRYRVAREYLVWTASRHGAGYAILDNKERGRARVVRDGLLRAGQALAVTLPSLMRAGLWRDGAARLEWRCRLARTIGYERQALRLAAPRALGQARFFESLNFRSERARFGRESSIAP